MKTSRFSQIFSDRISKEEFYYIGFPSFTRFFVSRKLSIVLLLLAALVIMVAGIGYHLYQYCMFSKQVTIEDVALNSIKFKKIWDSPRVCS